MFTQFLTYEIINELYDGFKTFFPDIFTGMLQFCSPSTLQTIDTSIVFASGSLTQTQDIPNTHTHLHYIYIYGEWPGLIDVNSYVKELDTNNVNTLHKDLLT